MGEAKYGWLCVWDPKKAGGGGVIRNNEGDWVAGFVKKFGNVSSITAELWAFKEGLLMAKQLGIENLCVDCLSCISYL